MSTSKHIIILLLVASFLFLFGLGKMALTDPDESFYAQTSKEMLEAGDWMTPRIFGKPQFEKPILYYWLTLSSFKIFGVNEFAARFPSAVFAIAGILCIYLIGRAIFSPLCGFLSGLIMSTSGLYLSLARGCITDIVLTVCIAFCFLFFILGWQKKKKYYFLLASVSAALAVLTKGPIGLFIPGLVILLYLVTGSRWKKIPSLPWASSIAVFLLVALPWYLLMVKLHGNTFTSEFFGFQNMTRFLHPEHRIGDTPFFYFPAVLGGIFPWTPFFLFGAWALYKRDVFKSVMPGHKLFLALWFLVIFLFFSISRTKLVTYVFPLFPVTALISGRLWERSIRKDDTVGLYMKISIYFLVLFSVAGMLGSFFFTLYKYRDLAYPSLLTGGILTAGAVFSLLFFLKGLKDFSFYSIIISILLVIPVFAIRFSPTIDIYESSKQLGQKVASLAAETDPIGGECDHRRGVAFYSGRIDIVDIHPFHDLKQFMAQKKRVWAILQRKHFTQLEEGKDAPYTETVDTCGKYLLITNSPISE